MLIFHQITDKQSSKWVFRAFRYLRHVKASRRSDGNLRELIAEFQTIKVLQYY